MYRGDYQSPAARSPYIEPFSRPVGLRLPSDKQKPPRLPFLDTYRGLLIILMVIYHLLIDLNMYGMLSTRVMYGLPLNLLQGFIAWGFIFVSGFCCTLSENNLKRGFLTLGCALLVTLTTYLFNPEYFVVFGILHFLGCAMIICALYRPSLVWFDPGWQLVGNLVIFALLFYFKVQIPFPMTSSDYFPLLPWLFLFFAGRSAGLFCKKYGYPRFFKFKIGFLSAAGKRTLLIYMLHQPILMLCVNIIILLLRTD